MLLFYRHRLREVAWLIDIAPAAHRDVVRKKLQRQHDADGCKLRRHRRN